MARTLVDSLVLVSDLTDIVINMLGMEFRILEDFITYDEIDKLSCAGILKFDDNVIKLILCKWCSVFSPQMYINMYAIATCTPSLKTMIYRYLETYITRDILNGIGYHMLFMEFYIKKYWSTSPIECIDYILEKQCHGYDILVKYPMTREVFDYMLSKISKRDELKKLLRNNQAHIDRVTIDKLRENMVIDQLLDVIPRHLRIMLEK
jgi:hypothetical protein